VAIHFTWKPEWDAVSKLMPLIEKELAPYDPRPHWGKLFTLEPAQLRSRYEKLADFKALIKAHDDHGKFRNEFLSNALFG
jgi:xylitol oxidase